MVVPVKYTVAILCEHCLQDVVMTISPVTTGTTKEKMSQAVAAAMEKTVLALCLCGPAKTVDAVEGLPVEDLSDVVRNLAGRAGGGVAN